MDNHSFNDTPEELAAMAAKLKEKKNKKKKKNTLKNYFKTVTNFQGFDKRFCAFEPSINDYVFVPKDYAIKRRQETIVHFCGECFLTPCISDEHHRDVAHHSAKWSIQDRLPNKSVIRRCETLMKGYMRKYFGRAYVTRSGLPNCAYELIGRLVPYYQKACIRINNEIRSLHLEELEDSCSMEDSCSTEEEL